MSEDHRFGFHFRRPPGWKRAWVRYWLISSVGWVSLAFILPVEWIWFSVWFVVFLAFFFVPEMVAIREPHDDRPPLTQVIRHFVPDDLAFPLLWGLPGAGAGRWLGLLPWWRFFFCGVVTGLLGWFTTHFTVTYARPDPHPHRGRGSSDAVRLQTAEDGGVVVEDPHPT